MDDSRIEYSHRDHYYHRQNDLMSNLSSSESSANELDEESLKQKAEAAREAMDKLDKRMML